MADFLTSQLYVLHNEGGYAPIDGDTYRGIARRFFPEWAGWNIIDSLKPLEHGEIIKSAELDSLVNSFYKANFWNKMLGDNIDNQAVATYCYDWFVNAGGNAVKCIQSMLGVKQDGSFGEQTLNALNAAGDILQRLRDKRIAYYLQIAKGDNAKYLTGWENRANGLYDRLLPLL